MGPLPCPVSVFELNPLHSEPSVVDGDWYVIYAGINPGVYQSRYISAI
jgi:hypothetical protein